MTKDKKPKNIFIKNPISRAEDFQELIRTSALPDYKEIVNTFGEECLLEQRFGFTSRDEPRFQNIITPYEYYQSGGRHVSDGGRNAYEKEALRNWNFEGCLRDKRTLGRPNGKESHWTREDYEAVCDFDLKLPKFRSDAINERKAAPKANLEAHLDELNESEMAGKMLYTLPIARTKMRCAECNGIPLPDPIKWSEGTVVKRWMHYNCAYRRTVYYEEKYLMVINNYRCHRRDGDLMFHLDINEDNFPTYNEYYTLVKCTKYCELCKHHFFADEPDEHNCDKDYELPLVPEESVKDMLAYEKKKSKTPKGDSKRRATRSQTKTMSYKKEPKHQPIDLDADTDEDDLQNDLTTDQLGPNDSPIKPEVNIESIDLSKPGPSGQSKTLRVNLAKGIHLEKPPIGAQSSPEDSNTDSEASPLRNKKSDYKEIIESLVQNNSQAFDPSDDSLDPEVAKMMDRLVDLEHTNEALKKERDALYTDNDRVTQRYAELQQEEQKMKEKYEKEVEEIKGELKTRKLEIEENKKTIKGLQEKMEERIALKNEEIRKQKESIQKKRKELESKDEEIQKLKVLIVENSDLSDEPIGDRSPSQLLTDLKRLVKVSNNKNNRMNQIVDKIEEKMKTKAPPNENESGIEHSTTTTGESLKQSSIGPKEKSLPPKGNGNTSKTGTNRPPLRRLSSDFYEKKLNEIRAVKRGSGLVEGE